MRTRFLRYEHSSQQRFGAIKALVALLDDQRHSIAPEKLDQALFRLLYAAPEVSASMQFQAKRARRHNSRNVSEEGPDKRGFPRNLGEELLVAIDAPSLLFTVPAVKITRIREWARKLGFIGSGNQITERGLLLQHLMGSEQISAIRRGKLHEHNPFRLSSAERIYFLYVLLERDGIWPYLIRRLAQIGEGKEIRGVKADEITCHALIDLLEAPQPGLSGTELLHRKEVQSLASYMAKTLNIHRPGLSAPRLRRAPGSRRAQQRDRMPTNTADDQAIPRLENLVDLGFLVKETPIEHASDSRDISRDRRLAWRYFLSPSLVQWVNATHLYERYDEDFLWGSFASSAMSAFGINRRTELKLPDKQLEMIQVLQNAYDEVRRPIGHTPFESVALVAMVRSAEKEIVCEMSDLHALMIKFKKEGLYPDFLKFASGNEVDKMFLDIRPGFLTQAREQHGN